MRARDDVKGTKSDDNNNDSYVNGEVVSCLDSESDSDCEGVSCSLASIADAVASTVVSSSGGKM